MQPAKLVAVIDSVDPVVVDPAVGDPLPAWPWVLGAVVLVAGAVGASPRLSRS